jgi:hypothetical protein
MAMTFTTAPVSPIDVEANQSAILTIATHLERDLDGVIEASRRLVEGVCLQRVATGQESDLRKRDPKAIASCAELRRLDAVHVARDAVDRNPVVAREAHVHVRCRDFGQHLGDDDRGIAGSKRTHLVASRILETQLDDLGGQTRDLAGTMRSPGVCFATLLRPGRRAADRLAVVPHHARVSPISRGRPASSHSVCSHRRCTW